MPDARENIVDRAPPRFGVKDTIRRHDRHVVRSRNFDQSLRDPFFIRDAMPLQFDIKRPTPERPHKTLHNLIGLPAIFSVDRLVKRSLRIAGKRNQPLLKFFQLLPQNPAFAFRRAKLGARQHPAQVPVARAVLHQYRQNRSVLQRQFTSHQGPQPAFPPGRIKPGRAVNAVPVTQRHRRQPVFYCGLSQVFRQRSSAQKTKRTAGMKFDVGHGPYA
jgi:hypothetical protein